MALGIETIRKGEIWVIYVAGRAEKSFLVDETFRVGKRMT